MKYKAILFDVSDTLVEYRPNFAEICRDRVRSQGMEIAFKELGLPPEQCLYVGDHPIDVLCSKKAGMDCAWIVGDWEKAHVTPLYQADCHIRSVMELMDIL